MVPKDAAEALTGICPVVASYGGRDASLRGAAARLQEALTRLDVPHAFFATHLHQTTGQLLSAEALRC